VLDQCFARLARQGEVVLAGFYAEPLHFNFPPAFMREASIRIAAQWQRNDLDVVINMVRDGKLSLDGLITHHSAASDAASAYETAFENAACLKMILDWRTVQ
jgi:bacteriochlorophyllide a dehydrogenase